MRIDSETGTGLIIEIVARLGRKLKGPLKACLIFPAFAIVLLLPGCTTCQQPAVPGPVGMGPAAARLVTSTSGSLMVYSFCEAVPDLSAEISGNISDHWEYSGYKILSRNGRLLKFVQNNAGALLLRPQQVKLPVGQYIVVARAAGGLRVTVPVIIRSHQTTALHLEGGDFQPPETGFSRANTGHLPDGQMAGGRAMDSSNP